MPKTKTLCRWLVFVGTCAQLIILVSCSSSNQTAQNSFEKMSDDFKTAYALYDQGDYRSAITAFTTFCDIDTFGIFYDAYPFLADSYEKLNLSDSGLIAYKTGIKKVAKRVQDNSHSKSSMWNYDSLVVWKLDFPRLPQYLMKSNGYVPYDVYGSPMSTVNPNYPEENRIRSKEGTSWITAIVDESGKVVDAWVLMSAGPEMDASSLEAMRQWRFTPFVMRGRVGKAEVTVPFRFRLRR